MDLLHINKNKSLIILAIASTTLAAYYLFKSKKETTKNGFTEIPLPKSNLPYVGHLLSLGELPGQTIAKWHKEYGPIIKVKMGVQNYIMISDPELIHELLVTKGAFTSDRPFSTYLKRYSYNGRGIVFGNTDKRWKQIRTAALEILAPRKVDEFSDLIAFEADNLIQQLIQRTGQDGQLNPLDFIQSTTLNVILQTEFGRRITSVDDPLCKEILYNVNQHMYYASFSSDFSAYLPILSFLDIIFRKERNLDHFLKTSFHPLFKRLAKEASDNNKDCFYTRFLKMKDQYGLEEKDILVTMSDIVVGGTDTVSLTLTWAVCILSNYSDIQKKITKEIDEYTSQHGRLPTFKDREQFQYLTMVIKEVMRFRSIMPFGFPHSNNQDVILRNYFIPKGSVLASSMEAMHMNPKVYDDPETFNPERFANNTRTLLSSANGNILDRDQYSFGWGRRICPGIYLAEVEMFTILTRLFAHCTIELALDKNGNEIPVDMKGVTNGFVLHPLPFHVRFLPRTDAPL